MRDSPYKTPPYHFPPDSLSGTLIPEFPRLSSDGTEEYPSLWDFLKEEKQEEKEGVRLQRGSLGLTVPLRNTPLTRRNCYIVIYLRRFPSFTPPIESRLIRDLFPS